jgi:hypothetical protein
MRCEPRHRVCKSGRNDLMADGKREVERKHQNLRLICTPLTTAPFLALYRTGPPSADNLGAWRPGGLLAGKCATVNC